MYDKIKVLTFAKGTFIDSQIKLKEHLTQIGIKNQKHLTNEDLPNSFYLKNEEIFKFTKGFGFCVWKPFIISNELNLIEEEEILLYLDSTDLPEKCFFDELINNFKDKDYFFVNRGYIHGEWTKRDTFVLMECDTPEFHNHTQLEAGVVGLKPTEFNKKLVEEWLFYATNINILSDIPNICNLPNLNSFKEHRYDQSILTNLFIKNKLASHSFGLDKIKYNYNQPKKYN